ncbi:MAG: NAD(+) diphosphatase [Wenzhouxiangellaceae bacterium]|nr:NAD(+) diphosphatase [Wenzhouxiangellaceae bacterium]
MPKTSSTENLPGTVRYAGGRLDRAHPRRDDDAWLARALADDDARLVPVWRDLNLVVESATAGIEAGRVSVELRAHADEVIFLGLEDQRPVFAAELSRLEREHAERLAGTGRFEDLRRVGPALPHADAALMSYARGIAYWHRNHRYCGRCGSPTESRRAGHLRVCTNSSCEQMLFPRTDPAVIMLVEHPDDDGRGPRCLLGRPRRFPAGVYSTLAGFVEPGESLEEAVAREVFEESGIELDEVRYLASQPWPFPSSLMIGFHARARTGAITRHDDELEDARWFSADEVRGAGEWVENAPLCLPRRDSIARFLIEQWLART